MVIKGIVDEDFVNFKKISMYIIMPYCSFKCDKENGECLCQNSSLINEPNIDIDIDELIERYETDPLSEAVVFGGLEPLDSYDELITFLVNFRYRHWEPVVIYTGYTEEEVQERFPNLFLYENLIIKYGRYRPNNKPHMDDVLGVKLASDNQYAKIYEPIGV